MRLILTVLAVSLALWVQTHRAVPEALELAPPVPYESHIFKALWPLNNAGETPCVVIRDA